ncbi:unnamed protein product [Pleuronectes platessa]|uniref:Uncharacterized protein n=1 Tax=Pleuronectes platessa TaxID=8262 RepID=A0A9N7U2J4_PLEPL|nr:unnamed protein product [Pleuronectes platessa]
MNLLWGGISSSWRLIDFEIHSSVSGSLLLLLLLSIPTASSVSSQRSQRRVARLRLRGGGVGPSVVVALTVKRSSVLTTDRQPSYRPELLHDSIPDLTEVRIEDVPLSQAASWRHVC